VGCFVECIEEVEKHPSVVVRMMRACVAHKVLAGEKENNQDSEERQQMQPSDMYVHGVSVGKKKKNFKKNCALFTKKKNLLAITSSDRVQEAEPLLPKKK
jgi:hypothetical protein